MEKLYAPIQTQQSLAGRSLQGTRSSSSGISLPAVHYLQRKPAAIGLSGPDKVTQLQKTFIAVFGQDHRDGAIVSLLLDEVKTLYKDKIPIVVCIEEAPSITLDDMIDRCRQTLDHPKAPDEVKVIARAELPLYEFLKGNNIPLRGVDSAGIESVDLQNQDIEKIIKKMEFQRLDAMTKGLLSAAGSLSKSKGGIVVGINFGSSHIMGLTTMLRDQANSQTSISGTMATGDYDVKNKSKGAKRSIESQQEALEGPQDLYKAAGGKKIKDPQTLAAVLNSFIESRAIYDDPASAGLTITCTSEYAADIRAVIDNAKSFADTKGKSASIHLDIDDDMPLLSHKKATDKTPLLEGAGEEDTEGGCCCVIQ